MKKAEYGDWLDTKEGKSYLRKLFNEMDNEVRYYSDLEEVFDNPNLPYLCELILN